MTSGRLLGAWAGALLLAGAVLGWLDLSARAADAARDAPVAVVGTSLMGFAVPAYRTDPEGLLGDGRAHRRIAQPALSETRLLAAAEAEVAAGRETVLLEIQPLAMDFATVPRRPGPVIEAWQAAGAFSRGARAALLSGLGLRPAAAPPYWGRPATEGTEELARLYPLRPRPPRDPGRLARLVDRAAAAGTRLVLVIPPRAASAEAHMGAAARDALRAHFLTVAAAAGLPVFAPSPGWDDALFWDTAHLNAAGRARFQSELRAWARRLP